MEKNEKRKTNLTQQEIKKKIENKLKMF